MPIVPDDKNWTWVLERPCPECGFDGGAVDHGDIAALARSNGAEWPGLLADERAVTRPSDDRWSALEYGCHVRDVFRIYRFRLGLMLDHDGPSFPNWDQDASAITDRYGSQHPNTVAAEIVAAAEALADRFDNLGSDQWHRTGFRSDGAAFTIDSFGRYMIHDPIHHLVDVRNGYARLTGGA
jgi:hypothetical protein